MCCTTCIRFCCREQPSALFFQGSLHRHDTFTLTGFPGASLERIRHESWCILNVAIKRSSSHSEFIIDKYGCMSMYTYVCKCKHVYVYAHFPGHDMAKSKKSRISIEMCWTLLASMCCVKPHQPLLKQELCTFFKTFFGCQHFEDAMTPLSTIQFNSPSERCPWFFFFEKMRGHALERSDDVKWIATQRKMEMFQVKWMNCKVKN